MTSPTTTTSTEQLLTPGRTVRYIVEYSPELVNEVWCRKILRQILQALELCYAKQQPHPAITPDSIALQPNGDAVLLSTATLPVENPSEPEDLRALASVIHYAITQELAPEGPLRGRALEGYSESLVGAIDRCMSSDPRQRPQDIQHLRNLLGIVSMGPALPQKPSAPEFVPRPAAAAPAAPAVVARPQATGGTGLARLQRWLMIAAAISILVAGGLALYKLLSRDQPDDDVVLSLPPAENSGAPAVAPAPATTVNNETATPALTEDAAAAPDPTEELVTLPPEETGATRPAAEAPAIAAAPAAEAGTAQGTTYKLFIKPWGTVYVNGVERGVSPPLKRLVLPAGEHTIRLVNPNAPDRVFKLVAGKKRSGSISHTFAAGSN